MRPRLTALLVLGLLAFAYLLRSVLAQHVQQTECTKVGEYELGGEPTKTDTVKFQDGIGAAWPCEEASWALKNGDTVMVFEGIVSGHHHVFVDFVSKDKPQEPEPKNPY